MGSKASFFVSLATLALGLLALERFFAWYGPNHFIPELRMRQALLGPHGCTVVAGDSRMVAGYDEASLARALRSNGRDDCVGTIAIGALRIPGLAIALREYLDRGARPAALVLGASEDTLLRQKASPDPSGFVGNETVLLSWSRAGDVFRLYPDFPFGNPRGFDQGFRFLVARANGFGRYLSLAWQKIQALQDRVTGRAGASNVFGSLSDMEAYGRSMQRTAHEELSRALEQPDGERLDPWFYYLERTVNEHGVRLVVVELPMPSYYREGITHSPEGQRYRAWLGERLERRDNAFIDLTSLEGLRPEHFADFVHLNASGARLFSAELGKRVSRLPAKPAAR